MLRLINASYRFIVLKTKEQKRNQSRSFVSLVDRLRSKQAMLSKRILLGAGNDEVIEYAHFY